jgi:hypothetical protein
MAVAERLFARQLAGDGDKLAVFDFPVGGFPL